MLSFGLVAVACRTRPSGYDEDGLKYRASPIRVFHRAARNVCTG